MFICLGFYALVPLTHLYVIEDVGSHIGRSSALWLGIMAAFYLSGVTVYSLRFPEKYFPGRFDIWVGYIQLFFYFCHI